jgi:WD40 repeat protein
VYKGHTSIVNSVSIGYNNRYIASASSDSSIIIWNFNNANIYNTLDGHSKSVLSIVSSKINTNLISAGEDELIILWNVDSL